MDKELILALFNGSFTLALSNTEPNKKTIKMKKRISVNPNIHFGKPCIAGARITVQSILELTREGSSFEKIMGDFYPDLKTEDIQACLQL